MSYTIKDLDSSVDINSYCQVNRVELENVKKNLKKTKNLL